MALSFHVIVEGAEIKIASFFAAQPRCFKLFMTVAGS